MNILVDMQPDSNVYEVTDNIINNNLVIIIQAVKYNNNIAELILSCNV